MQRKSSAGEFMRMWQLSVLVGAILPLTGCFQNASTATRDADSGTSSSSNGEKHKYSGMSVAELRRLRQLADDFVDCSFSIWLQLKVSCS
jgi:hypothetical protein